MDNKHKQLDIKLGLEVIISILCIILITNLLLAWSLSTITLVINFLILIVFYQYSQTIKSRDETRKIMMETTLETIHNGPLQSLAKVLRLLKGQDLPNHKLLPLVEQELEELNQELRGMYDFWLGSSRTREIECPQTLAT